MCNFLSAVLLKNNTLLCNPQFTDSHEDLLEANNVRDGLAQQDCFVRLEFLPPKDHSTIFDTKSWTLKVDQRDIPSWFNKDEARGKLAARVKRMFVLEDRKILLGGCWILGEDAVVGKAKSARIFMMLNNSKVVYMHDTSKVGSMRGNSKIDYMCDNSKVGSMHDTSKVVYMYDTSKVGSMHDNSKVDYMCDTSKVINDCR